MKKELTIKQDDFWRLINREQFLSVSFHVKLQYRIRMYFFSKLLIIFILFYSAATNNEYVYVHVNCDDKTIGEHAEVMKKTKSMIKNFVF